MHDFRITRGLARYPYIATPVTLTQTNSGMEQPDGTFPTATAGNTLFLTGHTTTIVDGSQHNTTITKSGTVNVSTYVPAGAPANMRSLYFDGSSDTLSATLPQTPGTADWTIEYWVYHNVTEAGNE